MSYIKKKKKTTEQDNDRNAICARDRDRLKRRKKEKEYFVLTVLPQIAIDFDRGRYISKKCFQQHKCHISLI